MKIHKAELGTRGFGEERIHRRGKQNCGQKRLSKVPGGRWPRIVVVTWQLLVYCIIGFLQVRSPNLLGWVYTRVQDQRDSDFIGREQNIGFK